MKNIFTLITLIFSFSFSFQAFAAVECERKEILRPSANKKYSACLDQIKGCDPKEIVSVLDDQTGKKHFVCLAGAPFVPIHQTSPTPAPLSYDTSADLYQDAPTRPTITPRLVTHASFDWEAADESNAESLVGDDGSVMYPYGASRPIVACAPLHICMIKLMEDEHITNISIGDSVRWKAQASSAGKLPVVIVKPTVTDIKTNLSIMTDAGRIYYLTLVSYKNHWVPLISFYDPQGIVQEVKQKASDQTKAMSDAAKKKEAATIATIPGDDIAAMDFEYVTTGPSSDIKPVRVFSTAGHTYIQMPEFLKYKDAPAIFSVVNGEQQLVNYKAKGVYYIVDGIPDKINLVLGAGSNAKTVTIQRKGS